MQRTLDTLALYGICAVLGVAFYYQFGRGELPCPLCALQRVGFVVAGVALVLNLVVAVLVTLALRAGHVGEGEDSTHPADCHADEGSRRLRPVAPAVAGTTD